MPCQHHTRYFDSGWMVGPASSFPSCHRCSAMTSYYVACPAHARWLTLMLLRVIAVLHDKLLEGSMMGCRPKMPLLSLRLLEPAVAHASCAQTWACAQPRSKDRRLPGLSNLLVCLLSLACSSTRLHALMTNTHGAIRRSLPGVRFVCCLCARAYDVCAPEMSCTVQAFLSSCRGSCAVF
jgi:hypothetical protein